MKCVLCGETSIGMERLSLSPAARKILEKRFPGMNYDEALASYGICVKCLALPPIERRNLADRFIRHEREKHRRDLLKNALKKRNNGN
jgi:hypothetical protein